MQRGRSVLNGSAPARRSRTALIGVVLVAVLTAAGGPAARADDYPTWKDVQQAQASEQRKQEQVARITSLLKGLRSRSVAAEKVAAERGASYERAQETLTETTYRSQQLDQETRAAERRATRSLHRAGNVAASLARSGGDTLTARLLVGKGRGTLLQRLEMMSQLSKASTAIYAAARRDRNAAAAAGAQARAVRNSVAKLAAAARTAFTAAKTAAQEAQTALRAQQANEATLRAQLTVLRQDRAATQADYEQGVAARREAARREAAAAAAAARAASAAAPGGGSGGGAAGASGGSWSLPVGGWISSPFGPRPDRPAAGVGPFHYGTDLAAGCGTPIRAASSGTVVYSGWLGTYGNWVLIDNGGGVQTGYAHSSAVLVSAGERVSAGQPVARVGTTGASSGCHLHFEVRVGGASVDPVPFMRARGITLG